MQEGSGAQGREEGTEWVRAGVQAFPSGAPTIGSVGGVVRCVFGEDR